MEGIGGIFLTVLLRLQNIELFAFLQKTNNSAILSSFDTLSLS